MNCQNAVMLLKPGADIRLLHSRAVQSNWQTGDKPLRQNYVK